MRRTIVLLLALVIVAALASACAPQGTGNKEGLHAAVPNVVGLQEATARTTLDEAGYKIGSVSATSAPDTEPGVVVEQTPLKGTSAPRDSAVDLVVSSP